MSDKHLEERTLLSEELSKGQFLHAFRDTVALPDDSSTMREYVVHPGAAMVVPLLEDEDGQIRIVLERQFRYPLKQVMVEFPAGKLDPGETGFACAQRELREETGYRAQEWARAGLLHPVSAYSTEFIEIWFARQLSLGERCLDAQEYLDVFTATPEQLFQWCRDGLVSDAKTLIGVLWLQNNLAGAWPLEWQSVKSTFDNSTST